uniref:Uncharacterized protein n=1 Tax=Arundo donax TaxID=35708 RepID=A0A0A9BK70_ARUDO
MANLHSSNK